MYNYIEGIIADIESNSVVLDNNGIGYNIFISNPYQFDLGLKYKIYLYNYIREDENSLYGFKTKEERDLFLRLINVKGLGPKVASNFFATGSVTGIIDAIDRENIIYLTKFPKVGDKLARQIILDLKGKLIKSEEVSNQNSELVDVLESLGYKSADIKKILPKIDYSKSIENQIKDALKLMLNN
jgi:Holliday junction DNA helicase RuvA